MLCSLPALLLGTFLVGALLPGARAQTIHQWPPTKVQHMGSPLSLDCTVKGTSNPNLYWYRQTTGGAPLLLFYSVSVDQVESQAPGHFTASRPQDLHFTLHSEKLLLNDSGLYLCAWSITLRWMGQTSVQKPHPTPSPPHPPQGPLSGTGCRVFLTRFLTASQCESNRIKPDLPEEPY